RRFARLYLAAVASYRGGGALLFVLCTASSCGWPLPLFHGKPAKPGCRPHGHRADGVPPSLPERCLGTLPRLAQGHARLAAGYSGHLLELLLLYGALPVGGKPLYDHFPCDGAKPSDDVWRKMAHLCAGAFVPGVA